MNPRYDGPRLSRGHDFPARPGGRWRKPGAGRAVGPNGLILIEFVVLIGTEHTAGERAHDRQWSSAIETPHFAGPRPLSEYRRAGWHVIPEETLTFGADF